MAKTSSNQPKRYANGRRPNPGKGTAKASSSSNGGQAELVSELRPAAVNLLGSIEPADYKRYVLPIIFLRFLSLSYERRREELARMVQEPRSEDHTKALIRRNLEELKPSE